MGHALQRSLHHDAINGYFTLLFSFETLNGMLVQLSLGCYRVAHVKITPTENKINAVREKKNVVHPVTPQNGVNGGSPIKHFDRSGTYHRIEQ